MKEVIQKAIEGGWKHYSSKSYSHQMALLDPIFWQSLGKALGWGDVNKMHSLGGSPHQEECWCEEITWQKTWHRFIDHLADEKDPDLFFKELLK